MQSAEIVQILKELTLDLAAGKSSRAQTVAALKSRIEGDLVYDMDERDPLRDLITQVYVSLENLTAEDFPPADAEIRYYAECFQGKREFRMAEVREFTVDSRIAEDPVENARPVRRRTTKNYARPNPEPRPRSARINH